MTFLTIGEVRRASQTAYGLTASGVREAIRKSATTSTDTWFDVFLSHSFSDAEIVAGVARLIEEDGQTVYVDWRDDRSWIAPR